MDAGDDIVPPCLAFPSFGRSAPPGALICSSPPTPNLVAIHNKSVDVCSTPIPYLRATLLLPIALCVG